MFFCYVLFQVALAGEDRRWCVACLAEVETVSLAIVGCHVGCRRCVAMFGDEMLLDGCMWSLAVGWHLPRTVGNRIIERSTVNVGSIAPSVD